MEGAGGAGPIGGGFACFPVALCAFSLAAPFIVSTSECEVAGEDVLRTETVRGSDKGHVMTGGKGKLVPLISTRDFEWLRNNCLRRHDGALNVEIGREHV